MFGLDPGLTTLLVVCLIAACTFEFINGFHDTANAVATVIYTKSLKPTVAVVWSGFVNFLGVFLGGIAVAMGIVNLLPAAALADQTVYQSMAMILALIITAIVWNLGTWYFGLPCSSSHTLLGSIFGVGLAYSILPDVTAVALNWAKVKDVGLSLLISPLIGFGLTLIIMLILKNNLKKSELFSDSTELKHPPLWIRSILILSCTSVSFFHGSNDGQKGVGLIMIILIAIIPAKFAIDMQKSPEQLLVSNYNIEHYMHKIQSDSTISIEDRKSCEVILAKVADIKINTDSISSFAQLNNKTGFALRKDITSIAKETKTLLLQSVDDTKLPLTNKEQKALKSEVGKMKEFTEYSPIWVIIMISLSLGIGTMIGWKRIVVTVGEKIGKTPLNYAQGASAELVTASTIGLSSALGLPVSTTHILSSGIAGSMVAQKGLKNLRRKTIQNIAIAWLITLPVTIVMAGLIFLLLRAIMG